MIERMPVPAFFELTRRELADLLGKAPKANILFNKVYRQRHLTDGFTFELPTVVARFESSDGTRRYLLQLHDGETIESVQIPEAGRFTFCVSSQVGCALACTFCLTGQLGLKRNLSAGEIVSQVVLLRGEIPSERFSVVLMGMGEPMQNYENVMKAIEILTDDHGIALPLKRMTLSTAGLVPGIDRLGTERLFPNLSISLTGTTDALRDELMPINKKYPIRDVVAAVQRLSPSRRKRVMFEYVMIKDLTDSLADAARLVALLRDLGAKVNLIPLNPSVEIPYERPGDAAILQFHKLLVQNGITTFIRKNRGNDVSGACGQLKKTVGV